jgi:hypothetical protein
MKAETIAKAVSGSKTGSNRIWMARHMTTTIRVCSAAWRDGWGCIAPDLPFLRTRTTIEPDKTAKTALKSEQDVPGADLQYRDNLMRK